MILNHHWSIHNVLKLTFIQLISIALMQQWFYATKRNFSFKNVVIRLKWIKAFVVRAIIFINIFWITVYAFIQILNRQWISDISIFLNAWIFFSITLFLLVNNFNEKRIDTGLRWSRTRCPNVVRSRAKNDWIMK